MTQINRRNVLKGLLATPAVFALRPIAYAQPRAPKPTALTTLNILFHGPFALVIFDDHIEAWTPEQDDHEYRFWGLNPAQVPTLPNGSHSLLGLKRENNMPPLDPSTSILVDLNLIKTVGQKGHSHCMVSLPFPKSLVAVCVSQQTKNIFKGRDSDGPNKVPWIPFTQALTYAIDDVNKLKIDNVSGWQAESNPGHLETANLHFEVLPKDPDIDGKHARKAFANEVSLLEGLQLELDPTGVTDCPTERNLPAGVASGSICPPQHVQAQVTSSRDTLCNKGLPIHCRAPGLILQKKK